MLLSDPLTSNHATGLLISAMTKSTACYSLTRAGSSQLKEYDHRFPSLQAILAKQVGSIGLQGDHLD